MSSSSSRRLWLSLVAAAVALGTAALPAGASTASEERQGAALVKALNAGDRSCSSLSAGEFERIGEFAMGLHFAAASQHDAMNRRMRAMMGERGEELSHQAMGRAYTRCTTSRSPGSGALHGMRDGSWPAMMGGSPYGPGMMNGARHAPTQSAGMHRAGGGHGWAPAAVVGVALLSATLAGGLVALLLTRGGRQRPGNGASPPRAVGR